MDRPPARPRPRPPFRGGPPRGRPPEHPAASGARWERQAPNAGNPAWPAPWVQLKYFSNHPHFFPAMIGAASPDARPGNLVAVFDKEGQRLGSGLWNPKARVPLRMVHYGTEQVGEEHFDRLLESAVDLRLKLLGLDAHSEAY